MGPEYFPSRSFFGGWRGGIILQLWLSEIADTCMRLRWPTSVKIDSDGIWWLTRSLGPEREKKWEGKNQHQGEEKKNYKDSHTLSNYTQGLAPKHLPSGRQHELGRGKEKKKKSLEYIYYVRLWPKHTRLRKADTCTLPPIILFTSLHDLKATGPLPRKQEELGHIGGWQLSDGPSPGDVCSVSAVSLVTVRPHFSCCLLSAAVKAGMIEVGPQNNDWPFATNV